MRPNAGSAFASTLGIPIQELRLGGDGHGSQEIPDRPFAVVRHNLADADAMMAVMVAAGGLEDGLAIALEVGQGDAGRLRRCQHPLLGGQEDAGRASDQVQAARGDCRVVEVVDIEVEVPLRGPVGAEVLQVQVAAEQDIGADIGRAQLGPGLGEQMIRPAEEGERIAHHPLELDPYQPALPPPVELEDRLQHRVIRQRATHRTPLFAIGSIGARGRNLTGRV